MSENIWCVYCGPTCDGGAAHCARAQDGTVYQPPMSEQQKPEIPQELRYLYSGCTFGQLFPAGTVKTLIERIAALQAENARLKAQLEWQPITPENLPKVGIHEVGKWRMRSATWLVCDVADTPWKGGATVRHYKNLGWSHFRPINPPAARTHAQDSAEEAGQ